MAIESATAAAQLALLGNARKAAKALQRFAERAQTVTISEAVPIDAALVALSAALSAAGVGTTLPATQKTLISGTKTPVGTVTGTGTFGTPTIVGGVITGIVLSAS